MAMAQSSTPRSWRNVHAGSEIRARSVAIPHPPNTSDTPPENRISREGFAKLYLEHYRSLAVVAAAAVGRTHAEDVVQEAAIVAFKRLDQFTAGTDFRAWMAAIVRGVSRNKARSEHRLGRRARALRRPGPPTQPAGATPGPLARVASFTTSDLDPPLDAAFASLSIEQRTCLLLKAVCGHSYREIGTMLDIPEATARTHAHRARLRLVRAVKNSAAAEEHHDA